MVNASVTRNSDDANHALWALGMGFAAISLLTSTTALLIQKFSTMHESGLPCHKRWRFWLGCGLNLGSELSCSTTAVALAPLALLAPLSGLGVVFNAVLAHTGCVCGVKERLPPRGWLSTGIIILGIILVATSGPGSAESTDFTMDDAPRLLSRPGFVALALTLAAYVVGWLLLTHVAAFHRCRPARPVVVAWCSAVAASCCSAISITALKFAVKGLEEMVDSTPWKAPRDVWWGCLALLCTVAPSQLYFLNHALASGNATFAIPIYLATNVALVSLIGGLMFSEFDTLMRTPEPLYLLMYVAGLLTLCAGLFALAGNQARAADPARGSARGMVKTHPITHPSRSGATPPSATSRTSVELDA